jgi:type II secretory pathway pseudopilin PulG
MVEMLGVLGILIVLLAILLPALNAARQNGVWATSQNNMRQLATWMRSYAVDNRDYVVPSLFDYSGDKYKGRVRSDSSLGGDQYSGTWTDILWTVNEIQPPAEGLGMLGYDYRYDSPDAAFYDILPDYDSPFRSAAPNSTRGWQAANEPGRPGYFAANNFFDARPGENGFWTHSQIKLPDRSLYLVDSFAGEVIEDEDEPFDVSDPDPGSSTREVDFRNPGDLAMMLMLDGSVRNESSWGTLDELEADRQIRVRCLNLLSCP